MPLAAETHSAEVRTLQRSDLGREKMLSQEHVKIFGRQNLFRLLQKY